MTDEERERIRREASEEARLHSRVGDLEKRIEGMASTLSWGVRAIWGVAIYLAAKVFDFIAGGGVIK